MKAPKVKDMTGLRFGRLVVTSFEGLGDRRIAKWKCHCDCGKSTVIYGTFLRRGCTSSCGCIRAENGKARATHGMRNSRPYSIWTGMMSRCNNPNATGYENYGGRGIKVCKEWSDFSIFFRDMGTPGKSKTLDRRDNNAGYSKDNCRWATQKEQGNNTRLNVFVTAFGESKPLNQWAEEKGIKYVTLYARLFIRKWSPEKSLTYGDKKCSSFSG